MRALLTAVLSLALVTGLAAQQRESVALTVYNQGLGLVKDVRVLSLEEGRQAVRFTDVAAQIDPTSVRIVALSDPNSVEVLEQNYQFDLVDRARLLQKYLGNEITLVRYDEDGQEIARDTATLLAAEGGAVSVVKIGDEIVLNPGGVVELPALPEGLIVEPTLLWDLRSTVSGPTLCEVSYMTSGISWQADYVLVVNAADTGGDLNGWVTLTNDSGATYEDAKLKLVAGDVSVQRPPMGMMGGYGGAAAGREMGGFEQQEFFEYYLYSLPRPTTVRERETKQILLMAAPEISLTKRFVFDPSEAWRYGGQDPDKKVAVKLEVENSEAQGLGRPLPQGRVRVFKADSDGALQFVGEDRIGHTPKDETVRLYIGNAFDLVGEQIHTNHQEMGPRNERDSFRVSLRNRKEDEAVEITYVGHFWAEWEILETSHEFKKIDARTAEWTVTVPAGEEVQIDYTVDRKW
jgi:hypothetical protein